MLFSSITDESCIPLINPLIDGIELRLDQIPLPNLSNLSLPYIFTPKTSDERLLEHLLSYSPPYFDLDFNTPPSLLHKIIEKNPKTKFILSYHNFEKLPDDLEEIFVKMQQFPVFSYKIAAFTKNCIEALKLLLFKKKFPKLSVICMGEDSQFARILGPLVGNVIDYAYLGDRPIAPGQLSTKDFLEIYRYKHLNPLTDIYALLGDPVSQSIGHLYHNNIFKMQNQNALYIKIKVKEEELASFFSLISHFRFKGFSVTMPLKEKIIPFLDELDSSAKAIGAVNTILVKNGRLIGTNTDGKGALDAFEKKGFFVKNKIVVIMGAGGAAKAVAHEANLRGAKVWIYNRDEKKAKTLNYPLGVPNHFDILIKCTPKPLPISFHSKPCVMDIVYQPKITPFLEEAIKKGCQIISGEEMFFNQAEAQSKLWNF